MRLINTSSLELRDFQDAKVLSGSYAILSHVWEQDEVSFHAFQNAEARQQLRGWGKIASGCRVARELDYRYLWVDTCCIDKSSSAELSEAINSMWKWYARSGVCLAYLVDVETGACVDAAGRREFEASRWFTRGFTLQELVAPAHVRFYNRDWSMFGTRANRGTQFGIMNATGITRDDLDEIRAGRQDRISVARRMSWAAPRTTTRAEDRAYCLMGLFDVHMPLLYGEGGRRAFYRLQLEILRQSADESVFAWTGDPTGAGTPHGMLAAHPRQFLTSGDVETQSVTARPPYHMTNRGLQIDLHLEPIPEPVAATHTYWNIVLARARLNCAFPSPAVPSGTPRSVMVFLIRRRHGPPNVWGRIGPLTQGSGDPVVRGSLSTVFVSQDIAHNTWFRLLPFDVDWPRLARIESISIDGLTKANENAEIHQASAENQERNGDPLALDDVIQRKVDEAVDKAVKAATGKFEAGRRRSSPHKTSKDAEKTETGFGTDGFRCLETHEPARAKTTGAVDSMPHQLHEDAPSLRLNDAGLLSSSPSWDIVARETSE